MKKQTEFRFNYVSNVKLKRPNEFIIEDKTKTLYAKRVIVLLFLLKGALGYSTKYKLNFFFLKKKRKSFNILRAPYKNKIAQNSYMWSRYYFSIIFKFYDNFPIVNEERLHKNLTLWFDSLFATNISNLKSIKISYNTLCKLKI